MARPTDYTQEKADEICELIATSPKSLRTVAKEVGVSVRAIMNWLNTHEEFVQQYARAKQEQADFLIEETLEIADDSSNDTKVYYKDGKEYEVENSEWINRSKLRVETRKWIASKLKPKKYGDRIDIDHTTGGDKITPTIILESTNAINDRYGFNSSLETGAEAGDGV